MSHRIRLLTFDCLPINCAACFGGESGDSIVALDRLAQRSAVFDQHYLQKPAEEPLCGVFGDDALADGEAFGPECVSLVAARDAAVKLSDADYSSIRKAQLGWLHIEMPNCTKCVSDEFRSRVEAGVAAIDLVCSDDDVLIVTATGGQQSPDLGRFESLLPEGSIRVPLLIATGEGEARRIHTITGSLDLAPTIAELRTGQKAGPGESTDAPVSLLQVLNDPGRFAHRRLRIFSADTRAVRTAQFLFVERFASSPDRLTPDQALALYAKPEDVWNVHDVSGEYRDMADDLQATCLAGTDGVQK